MNTITHNYLMNIFFLICLVGNQAIIFFVLKFRIEACSTGATDKGNAEQCTVR